VRGYNKNGQFVKTIKDDHHCHVAGGSVGSDMVYTAPASGLAAVMLTAKSGELSATARFGVIATVAMEI
jgi:hypothetical protein